MSQQLENGKMSCNLPRGLRRRGTKGIWQHSRRVPARYAHLESRQLIRTSLHTQDLNLALAKAAQIELLQNEEWELALQNAQASRSFHIRYRIHQETQISADPNFQSC